MKTGPLTRPRRYQLRKSSLQVLASGHPWLFRGQMSSAAEVFRDGQWLALVDQNNRAVGTGMYEAEGAIAIRVLERSDRRPDAAWVAERVDAALARREPLSEETDAYRAVHGESDGLPAVVVDVYGDTGVLQTYSTGAEALGRLVAARVRSRRDLRRVLWKPAHRRLGPAATVGLRALWGNLPVGPLRVREGALDLRVDLAGQKSGAYLDLRGLRRWLGAEDLDGRRVLNLFSYTGWIGLAAERAGAALVWNVNGSRAALDVAAAHHTEGRGRFTAADAFEWIPALDRGEEFDLVIADPPPMTSRVAQVERALTAYRRLYAAIGRHVAPGGRVVACCCTSRIGDKAFRRAVAGGLGPGFRFERRLPAEVDHPVGFAEADYLKVALFVRDGQAASK